MYEKLLNWKWHLFMMGLDGRNRGGSLPGGGRFRRMRPDRRTRRWAVDVPGRRASARSPVGSIKKTPLKRKQRKNVPMKTDQNGGRFQSHVYCSPKLGKRWQGHQSSISVHFSLEKNRTWNAIVLRSKSIAISFKANTATAIYSLKPNVWSRSKQNWRNQPPFSYPTLAKDHGTCTL